MPGPTASRSLPLLLRRLIAPYDFARAAIPVVSATDLMVFKMLCNRTKDWADVESLLEAGAGDPEEAARWITDFLGTGAPQVERLARTQEEIRGS